MKKLILLFVLVIFFYQCNSQKSIDQSPLMEIKTTNIDDPKYFIGNWYNTKTFVVNTIEKQLQSQSNCEKKSYWKFELQNNHLKNSFFTAKGKNCSEFISTQFGKVDFEEDNMIYRTDDIVNSVKIRIISDSEFVLITKSLINGNVKNIEKTYTKKK